MRVWLNISEPGSRVKLLEADSRARLVRVWVPLEHRTFTFTSQGRTQEFFAGGRGVKQIQFRIEGRENGDQGEVAP
jgi:hypothetical protein